MKTNDTANHGMQFPEIYTVSADDQMGHDNFGHTIPELIESGSATVSATFASNSTASSAQYLNKRNCNITTTNLNGAYPCEIITNIRHQSQQQQQQHPKMSPLPMHNRPLIGRRLALSVDVLIGIFFILWLLVIELGIFPQVKRGFYCDDRSISMHYNGETISTVAIAATIIFMYPILWICEACYFVPVSLKSSRFIESAARAWKWFKEYLFGCILHLFVVDGLKVLFGELRPHFMDTCRPDKFQTCRDGQYVVDYKCTNVIDSSWFVHDASKSFPSGHSSTSFYEAVFIIWYLQMRSPRIRSRLLIPTLQCTFLMYASLCSFSRITDHRHHWWDVLAGATIGIVFATATCIFFCKNFRTKKIVNVEPILQNGSTIDHRHTSVRRLLSERTKDELNLNHVVVP